MAATALDHLSLGGRIDWLAQLDTAFQPARNYRRTSIVRTAKALVLHEVNKAKNMVADALLRPNRSAQSAQRPTLSRP